MSKAKYSLAQEAEADLIDIARYTAARWGLERQRIYIAGLYSLFDDIAEQPLLGVARPELGFPTRMRRYERSHTVYYDYAEGGRVDVLRILHVRQDDKAAFEG